MPISQLLISTRTKLSTTPNIADIYETRQNVSHKKYNYKRYASVISATPAAAGAVNIFLVDRKDNSPNGPCIFSCRLGIAVRRVGQNEWSGRNTKRTMSS